MNWRKRPGPGFSLRHTGAAGIAAERLRQPLEVLRHVARQRRRQVVAQRQPLLVLVLEREHALVRPVLVGQELAERLRQLEGRRLQPPGPHAYRTPPGPRRPRPAPRRRPAAARPSGRPWGARLRRAGAAAGAGCFSLLLGGGGAGRPRGGGRKGGPLLTGGGGGGNIQLPETPAYGLHRRQAKCPAFLAGPGSGPVTKLSGVFPLLTLAGREDAATAGRSRSAASSGGRLRSAAPGAGRLRSAGRSLERPRWARATLATRTLKT